MHLTPNIFKRIALVAGTGLFITACAETPSEPDDLDTQFEVLFNKLCPVPMPGVEDNVTINIRFVDIGGNLCPKEVDLKCPVVWKGKKLTFVAVDSNWKVFDENPPRFRVYFAPIQGQHLTSAAGQIQRPIDNDVPKAIYKYTVWDWPQGGGASVCDPLDPNFRVNE